MKVAAVGAEGARVLHGLHGRREVGLPYGALSVKGKGVPRTKAEIYGFVHDSTNITGQVATNSKCS